MAGVENVERGIFSEERLTDFDVLVVLCHFCTLKILRSPHPLKWFEDDDFRGFYLYDRMLQAQYE